MNVSNLNLKTLPFHLMNRKPLRLSYNAIFFVFGCHLINLHSIFKLLFQGYFACKNVP